MNPLSPDMHELDIESSRAPRKGSGRDSPRSAADSGEFTECPVCLEDLRGLEIVTACCKQRLHTKCLNDMIDFYESTERDTPCPLCRSIISRYISIDIPDAQERPIARSASNNVSAQKIVYCVSFTVLFNMVIMFTYKLVH